jgi:CRP-like cAMP-binding protein
MIIKSIVTQLLQFPLFQGMTVADMDNVVGRTAFGFHKFSPGKTVVEEGQPCSQLYMLLSGTMRVESRADDHSYRLTETMAAPMVIQLDVLFGFTQRYTRTCKAAAPCQFITISKAELLRLCEQHEIFRLNLLNMICTQSQRAARLPWRQQPATIRQKIVRFIEERALRPAGPKVLHAKMEVLAHELAESRLNISHELNAMQDEGLLHFSRGIIQIPALERLR